MARVHSTLTSLFTDIANAIRSKTGSNEVLIADAFPSAITAIPTGGGGGDTESEDALIQRTLSGTYTNSRVSTIGGDAFTYCTELAEVSFPKCAAISDNAFYGNHNLVSISFPICISIDDGAFFECYNLVSAIFPECTSIGGAAFQYCESLELISFPKCTTIGYSAFEECYNLVSAIFPECTGISTCTFQFCESLELISFPKCTHIGNEAFLGCINLMSAYFLSTTIPILSESTVFDETPMVDSSYTGSFGSIIILESMIDVFKTAANWSYYSSRFSVYNGTD